MKALIFENKVVDVQEKEFDVSPSMTWMDAPEGCQTGWILENKKLVTSDKRTDEQKKADNLEGLRMERNFLLSQTDWWASQDLTMTDEQKKYRQDLRDITKTATSLDDVTWPTKPGE